MTESAPVPVVSIVIPAYNGGDLLRRAVGSVIAQTLSDWECIVIDDGGTDDLAWLDGIDPRVRLVRQVNAGVSVTRNRGAALAIAPRVAFCDQDDEWLPRKLELQIDTWSTGTICSITDFSWEFSDGRSEEAHQLGVPTWLSMVRNGHMCLSSLVVDRAAFWSVGGFDPTLAMEQDWLLFVLLLRQYPNTVRVVAEVMGRYYLHESNGSRDYARAYAERANVLNRLATAGGDEALQAFRDGHRLNRRLRSMQAIDASREARRRGDWRGVAFGLSHAVRWDPRATIHSLRKAF